MSRAARQESAKKAYTSSPLAKINRARMIGASLGAMQYSVDSQERLRLNGYKQPVSTLDEYQRMAGVAAEQIDKGREPYLVDTECLNMGLHPLIAIWDVGIERQDVGSGRHRAAEMVMVCLQRGDALLPPDTLVLWG